jgi:hypothetical protein
MSKTIRVDKDGMVLLKDFEDFLDIDKVKFYSLKVNKDKTLTLKFFDSKKKTVRPYERT